MLPLISNNFANVAYFERWLHGVAKTRSQVPISTSLHVRAEGSVGLATLRRLRRFERRSSPHPHTRMPSDATAFGFE
jgi:hypothetical protein